MSTDHIILKFSVCKKLLARRKEITGYLEQHIAGLKVLTFTMEDRLFTMDVRAKRFSEGFIVDMLVSLGFTVKFIRAI